jgi:hypothetical protein
MLKRYSLAIFLGYVFLTFFVNTVEWYTHAETYPVSALVGPNEWTTYMGEYERRLLFALYIPWGLLLLTNAVFIVRPIAGIPRSAFILTFALNLSILFVSLFLAVPLHNEHAIARAITPEGLDRLLQVNALRLGIAFFSSGVVAWMLVKLLTPAFAKMQLQAS